MLELCNVTAGYTAGVPVLTGIELAVPDGSAVGVIGRNGAGKTCLAQTLIGVLRVHSGDIVLDGKPLNGLWSFQRVRRRLALVPEGRLVFQQLTVRENLEMAAYGAGLRLTPARLTRVHELFPLLAKKDADRAGSLSGGEQQWLALGRALVQEPEVIVLDEPSLGLSPVAIESLTAALREIRDQGLAMVLMEQNPHLLGQLCSTVVLLDRGTISKHLDVTSAAGARQLERAYLGG